MAKSKIIVKSVKVNEKYESFIKEVSGEDAVKEDRLFKYQHMLMRFAATLGYRLKEKENLKEGKSYEMVIRRVIDHGPELENIQSITYKELCLQSHLNPKTLITSAQ